MELDIIEHSFSISIPFWDKNGGDKHSSDTQGSG